MNEKKIEKKPKRNLCIAIIAFAVALAFIMPVTVFANNEATLTDTIVSIDPLTQTVNNGVSFTVDVYVEPGEPISGIQLDLFFDQTIVQADLVTEGDLFSGHAVLFSAGTIDNSIGKIGGVYLVVTDMLPLPTDPGIFVTISFTALDKPGTSTLDLDGIIKVIDALGNPVSIVVNDGTIIIEGVEKIWDLYATWECYDVDPTNIMISWNNNEFTGCVYTNITLMRDNPFPMEDPVGWEFVTDMLTESECTYEPRRLGSNWLTDQFQIIATGGSENSLSNEPKNPNPSNGDTGVDIDADLSWTCDDFAWGVTLNFDETSGMKDYVVFGEAPDANDGNPPDTYDAPKPPEPQPPYIRAWFDDNLSAPYDKLCEDYRNCGGAVTYDVYFGTTSIPPQVVWGESGTSYNPGAMSYDTTYYWKIVAWDNHGDPTLGPIWSFTTKEDSEGGDPPTGDNQPPIADASACEPYHGSVDSEILFDGTLSHDPDGYIKSWEWDFDDGTDGSGETVIHIYSNPGTYTVILTVTDNEDAKDTDETTVIIGQANNPPVAPTVDGVTSGDKDTEYTYTAVSTDLDEDDISYFFDWDDDTDTTSDFLASGTPYSTSHKWLTSGVYTVAVYAEDINGGVSDTTEITVFIDIVNMRFIDDVIQGYLLDMDNDGIYDVFHNNATGTEITVELQENGNYLIDSDGDDLWDYEYDPQTNTLIQHSGGGGPSDDETDGSLWYLVGTVIILLAIILIMVYGAKKLKERREVKKEVRRRIKENAEQESKEAEEKERDTL